MLQCYIADRRIMKAHSLVKHSGDAQFADLLESVKRCQVCAEFLPLGSWSVASAQDTVSAELISATAESGGQQLDQLALISDWPTDVAGESH